MENKQLQIFKFSSSTVIGYYDKEAQTVEDACYIETGIMPSGQLGINLNPISSISHSTKVKINLDLVEFSSDVAETVKTNFVEYWTAICNNPVLAENCPCANPPSALALPPVKKLFL